MQNIGFIFPIFLIIFFQSEIYSQNIINIGKKEDINITSAGSNFTLEIKKDEIDLEDKYIAISTIPKDYVKPAFIYVTLDEGKFPSPDYRNYSSQEIGRNILYLKGSDFYKKEAKINIFNLIFLIIKKVYI